MASEPSRPEEESRRILKQIDQETDPGRSFLEHSAMRARDHVTAKDADQSDASELWGTRIGRILGIVLLIVLLWYLITMIAGEG